jgi:hypothetical protein
VKLTNTVFDKNAEAAVQPRLSLALKEVAWSNFV